MGVDILAHDGGAGSMPPDSEVRAYQRFPSPGFLSLRVFKAATGLSGDRRGRFVGQGLGGRFAGRLF